MEHCSIYPTQTHASLAASNRIHRSAKLRDVARRCRNTEENSGSKTQSQLDTSPSSISAHARRERATVRSELNVVILGEPQTGSSYRVMFKAEAKACQKRVADSKQAFREKRYFSVSSVPFSISLKREVPLESSLRPKSCGRGRYETRATAIICTVSRPVDA